MKKSLIALAVAGAFAAPAMAATSNVDVYGIVSVALEDNNISGVSPAIVDRVSRIGFKGSEDLGGGLKAIWQIESGLSSSASSNQEWTGNYDASFPYSNAGQLMGGGTLAGRNTFVGLSGGFGTVLMGRHDTPYKLGTGSLDPFADTAADYNGMNASYVDVIDNIQDARSPSALAYISPTWSGFHFAVAAVMASNTSASGSLASSDKTVDATSATAVYANGPLFASLSYQDVKTADSTAWKLGLGYTFGDAKVGFIYEDVDYDNWNRHSYLLNGVYNMGPIALKAEYGKVDTDSGDAKKWAVGVDYNLSKRTTAYVVYDSGKWDYEDRVKTVAIGMKHSF